LKAIFLSSYVPRECGIATFAEDVLRAVAPLGVTGKVIAMQRPGQRLVYDNHVIATIEEHQPAQYTAAAELINRSGCHVLSVQHEFGIFGGEECMALPELLEAVALPVATTFHTVLSRPSPAMRRHLRAVARHSDRIVVMNALAVETLVDVYDVERQKIVVVHHGAPVVPRARLSTIKRDLGLQGRRVISTFGLLSSGKGLEYAVQAMPEIVARHPEAVYLILGQTHPVVKGEEGECYRESLRALAVDLGVEGHVRFVDKYFTKAELVAYLLATDIYLTPYLNMEQVTSGTLAYAMACGRPLVSTPYLYAQFLLGDDRGLLVPPRDPREIADACLQILDHPDLQARMERTNWRYGQTMVWPRVGQDYLRLFRRMVAEAPAPAPLLHARASA
jgi:glycosyltransferase involved in cell wall biosynthesis